MKTVYESGIVQFLSRLADLILLQFAFLITSIPVFTIGTGLTALFSVCRKLRQDSVSYVLPLYFAEFKANFKTGTKLWLAIVLMAGITYADVWFCAMGSSWLSAVGQVISYMLMIAVFLVFLYSFPQAAWPANKVTITLKNSLLLALTHPVTTILVAVLYIVFFIAAEVMRPLFFLLGFSSAVYLAAGLFGRALLPEEKKR